MSLQQPYPKQERSAPMGVVCVALWAGLAALSCLLIGCGGDAPVDDPVVLKINEREIRVSELQAQIDLLRASGASALRDKDSFLKTYIERQVALDAARRQGLEDDPELRRQWENLLIGRMRQDALESAYAAVSVSEEDVRAHYERHIADYTVPARLRAALLRLEIDPVDVLAADTDAVGTKMEAARAQAEALDADTKGFGAMAMRFSDEGTSRFKGGDIGWLEAGRADYRWPQPVVDALFALSPEAPLSPVIETPQAVYLVKYIDHRPERQRPLDAALAQSIERRLLTAAREEVRDSTEAAWRAQTNVELREAALERIDFFGTDFQLSHADEPQPTPFQ